MIKLYVKTHNKTGLKYFGKTTKNNVESYTGSGKYWLNHLKKHGNDVTTEIIAEFDNEHECSDFAINFSKQNNIVESEQWANLRMENGLDGAPVGNSFSKETIEKMRLSKKGRHDSEYYRNLGSMRKNYKQPESQKQKVADKLSKIWKLKDPNGNEFVIKNLSKFCRENGLDQGNLSSGRHKGWLCEKV